MIKQACDFINSNADKFFLICVDRVLVYDVEEDSRNDDGARAVDSFRYEAYQMTADGFAECCSDIGVEFEQI